jgi:hypothetical protein
VTSDDRGFVAIEWVAAVGLLLLPVVVLVATLPTWAERRHAATVAAREAVREIVREWPDADTGDVTLIAREVTAAHGIDGGDITVQVSATGDGRGSLARVEVGIVMPAIAVMGVRAGAWHYTAVATRRIDDYRSR